MSERERAIQDAFARAVAERCAPLVEALERIVAARGYPAATSHLRDIAQEALAAYHAAQGAGRET